MRKADTEVNQYSCSVLSQSLCRCKWRHAPLSNYGQLQLLTTKRHSSLSVQLNRNTGSNFNLHEVEVQTHKRFKISLFIRTKHKQQLNGEKGFIKMRWRANPLIVFGVNYIQSLEDCWHDNHDNHDNLERWQSFLFQMFLFEVDLLKLIIFSPNAFIFTRVHSVGNSVFSME